MKDNTAPAGASIAAETARQFAADALVEAGLPPALAVLNPKRAVLFPDATAMRDAACALMAPRRY